MRTAAIAMLAASAEAFQLGAATRPAAHATRAAASPAMGEFDFTGPQGTINFMGKGTGSKDTYEPANPRDEFAFGKPKYDASRTVGLYVPAPGAAAGVPFVGPMGTVGLFVSSPGSKEGPKEYVSKREEFAFKGATEGEPTVSMGLYVPAPGSQEKKSFETEREAFAYKGATEGEPCTTIGLYVSAPGAAAGVPFVGPMGTVGLFVSAPGSATGSKSFESPREKFAFGGDPIYERPGVTGMVKPTKAVAPAKAAPAVEAAAAPKPAAKATKAKKAEEVAEEA